MKKKLKAPAVLERYKNKYMYHGFGGDVVFKAVRASVYAAVPGKQRKKDAEMDDLLVKGYRAASRVLTKALKT